MTPKSKSFNIKFGALCPPLGEQLRNQGLNLDLDPMGRQLLQRDIDEVTRLAIRGVITESERDRARKRLMQTLKKHLKHL
jgi:hypothetical protein